MASTVEDQSRRFWFERGWQDFHTEDKRTLPSSIRGNDAYQFGLNLARVAFTRRQVIDDQQT